MEELFFQRIQSYIPDEFEQFLTSMEKPMFKGLRVNTKKISVEHLKENFTYLKSSSPFCKEAFYIEEALGNHPYHLAGLYYLQEPSASSAVEILDVEPNDTVLDLCAAPGGKSTQIASKLGPEGFLVSNEIDGKRAQILLSNLERIGMMNMTVTNATPETLCNELSECFDKVLVDAPCSGEGMIKKHDVASSQWSYDNIELCATRQQDILEHAYKALKKDGILVYSTCTYAKEENEDVIAKFLELHSDMELLDVNVSFGRRGLCHEKIDSSKVCRIFPMDQGEGHFVAKLRKHGGNKKELPVMKTQPIDKVVKEFLNQQLKESPKYYFIHNEKVFGMNQPFIKVKKIKVLRQGIYLGTMQKNRFEPEHAFYLCSDWIHSYQRKVDLTLDQIDKFMHGLEIECECEKGYIAVCVDGYPFGFGKSDGKRIKNKIPKGLRFLPNSHILK